MTSSHSAHGIDRYIDIAIENLAKKTEEREKKTTAFKEKQDKREAEIMSDLTDLYFVKLRGAIERASKGGNRYKYMNFDREKCKANFPGLGKPSQVLGRWLDHMTNPESPYLLEEDGEKQHLEGLKFDVWNNGAFTVHFTW